MGFCSWKSYTLGLYKVLERRQVMSKTEVRSDLFLDTTN